MTGIVITSGENRNSLSDGGDIVLDSGKIDQEIDISIVVERVKKELIETINYGNIELNSGIKTSGGNSGNIIFKIGGIEYFRINYEGKFIKNGKEIGEDKEILIVFRTFLNGCASSMNR